MGAGSNRKDRMAKAVVGFLLGLVVAVVAHGRLHPNDRWYAPKGAHGTIEENIGSVEHPDLRLNAHIFDVRDGKVEFIWSTENHELADNTTIVWKREARAWDALQQQRSYLCADRLAGIKMFLEQAIAIWGVDSPVVNKIAVIDTDNKWRSLRAEDFAQMPDTCPAGRERVILGNDRMEPRRAVFTSGLTFELPGKTNLSICAPSPTDLDHWEVIDMVAIKWVPDKALASSPPVK
jgi:hypothetical protein